ncbi:uncharacterized protein FSUBG_13673 [Fusarium subglutinans]|uniref:Uncharacterized protein n=1 Tax=Gibberella subglutinans TaxID=42677 RepID=A0A8H5NW17_GIBSU|nr:uncharacterized protein FSUBG_13673 [Fusarium subglutinans]KAF5579023.1 hypothetical protein FSUBG_13673 [Fusarium subglutinans]
MIPRNEPTTNVSAKRRCVSQDPDAPSDIITTMEDLRLQIVELRQRQRDEHAGITSLKSDVAQHKAKALVMEMKLCELEKERQKNNEKIVKTDKISKIQMEIYLLLTRRLRLKTRISSRHEKIRRIWRRSWMRLMNTSGAEEAVCTFGQDLTNSDVLHRVASMARVHLLEGGDSEIPTIVTVLSAPDKNVQGGDR